MVGQGVLREWLIDPEIGVVVTVGRNVTGIAHPKLQEIRHQDMLDYRRSEALLTAYDACFCCLGVSSAGMRETDYERLTHGVTLAAAR